MTGQTECSLTERTMRTTGNLSSIPNVKSRYNSSNATPTNSNLNNSYNKDNHLTPKNVNKNFNSFKTTVREDEFMDQMMKTNYSSNSAVSNPNNPKKTGEIRKGSVKFELNRHKKGEVKETKDTVDSSFIDIDKIKSMKFNDDSMRDFNTDFKKVINTELV
eukprot:CAMPEP_0116904414 /NCGR_PEP_ID=MMETSP0467-20121206/11414_1 /TAXON_ID=283647 /ORGANISM="Mesodinium pulex, Strain SPMC105" /LENGTH=160 /DNA_ID=CAMNT_0004579073 /DNA_START=466 /DNA_END=948 /DNA_ORIENTATION=-